MDRTQQRLLREIQQYMQTNGLPDATPEDAYDRALSKCGLQADDRCLQAGSKYCDWECPIRKTEP